MLCKKIMTYGVCAGENTVSSLGRAVLIIWLFVVLIINSSYTASLTSILTVKQLSTTIQGVDSLASTNLPIGYQKGSFVADYLSEKFNIAKNRLVPLETSDNYSEALSLGPNKKGGVAAVVDELPYVESFLSTQCEYIIVGSEFSKGGWGFVFPKDSQLAVDMSTAILALSESGELQRIHDSWLKNDRCSLDGPAVQSNQFGLESFRALFLVTGIVCFVALFVFFFRIICQFTRYADTCNEESPGKSQPSQPLRLRSAKVLRSFASFVDEREDNEKLKRLKRERSAKKMDPEFELSQPQSPPIC